MTTRDRKTRKRKSKRELDELRPKWLTADVAEGLKEIDKGESCDIEIDSESGEYRVV